MTGADGSPWTAVLFDLDGTLADTVELILHCYRHTMEAHLGEAPPDSAWLATIGTPLREQLRDFARDPEEAAAMLDSYVEVQREVHDRMVRVFPGVPEVLGRLADAGVALGVVTSKRREMAERTLEACGIRERFPVVVTATDVERGKPDPEPVRMALAGLGDPDAGSVLFLGDSPYDLEAGRRAGVRTAGALWGPYEREALEAAGPDHLVEEIRLLPGLPGDGASAGG